MNASKHAVERALTRYGITAPAEAWRALLLDILDAAEGATGSAVLLRREAAGVERWLARLGETPVIAVYNPERALIMTVLPQGARAAFSENRQKPGRPRRRERARPLDEGWA